MVLHRAAIVMALSKLTSPLCIIACSASTFVHVQQRSRLTERLDRRVEIDGDYFGAERAIAPSTVGWGGVVRKERTILGTAFLTITRIYEPQRLVSVLPSLYHERHIY